MRKSDCQRATCLRVAGVEMREQRYDVLMFGGPLHGQRRSVETDNGRFAVAMCSPVGGLSDFAGERWISRPSDDPLWYEVQQWGERAEPPVRYRRLAIAVLTGYSLTDQEQYAVGELLEQVPWELKAGNILGTLDDFEQWFACQWYKQTGEMHWKGERVL